MYIQTLIGKVSNAESVTVKGEPFYKATFTFDGYSVPCTLAQSVIGNLIDKTVKVSCVIQTDTVKDKLHTCLYINKVEECKAKEVELMESPQPFSVNGMLKKSAITLNAQNGGTNIFFRISYKDYRGVYCTAHGMAKEGIARAINEIADRSFVVFQGHLKTSRDVILFEATEIIKITPNNMDVITEEMSKIFKD